MAIADKIKSLFDLSAWSDKTFISNELVKKGLSFELDPSNYGSGLLNDERWFFDNNGGEHLFSYNDVNDAIKAYEKCPPITAIINKKAQAYVNGKTWVLNAKNKEADTPDAKKLKKLLQRPNPLQTWKQFEAQNYIYTQLFGFCVVLPIKPVGFKENIDASSLWNIPPFLTRIVESNKLFYQTDSKSIISSIKITYRGQETDLNVEDVYIMKDFVPSFSSLVIPDTRIRSLSYPINNVIGAYESRNVLINNRGPQYVVSSNKSDESGKISLSVPEKEALQRDFSRYGLRKGQWKQIITQANISLNAIGFPTKDLMLFEEIEGSTMAICDGFGYPYRLLAAEKSASYNDVSEFKKMLYQDAVQPEAESLCEQWNEFFKLSDYKIRIDKDYSHIPALQADALSMAQARNQRNQALEREYRYDNITLNRWRELNGEDTLPDGDIYFSEWKKINGDPFAKDTGRGSDQSTNNSTDNNGQSKQ